MQISTEYYFIIAIVALIFIFFFRKGNPKFLRRFGLPFYKYNNDTGGSRELDQKLVDYYDQVLRKYIDYYKKLNKFDRRKFIMRLHEFIQNMNFVGKEEQEINLKVCVLCSAPAIQLSLGLDNFQFNHYHTIVVYPQQFYSEQQKNYVKGGVGRGDAIFFSYQDLEKGFRHHNDGVNLGLHEMAHAIHIEYFDESFENEFPNWEQAALNEMPKILNHPSPILREYALHNRHELFAVCCEVFFEQPGKLKKQSEKMYFAMQKLFNQDPCNFI